MLHFDPLLLSFASVVELSDSISPTLVGVSLPAERLIHCYTAIW